MNKETRVVAVAGTVSSTLDDEAVILHVTSGKYFGLNEVGQFIWQRIHEPAKVGDLCKAVQEEYAVNAGQCEKDVITLLDTLAEKGLIEVHAETGS
ncbi:MAG: PqqD family protein [Candidatus Hydrogenedentes bacterium]|nr:PqqD family protein [Candidatus Hydrogenedentota bacterium]